MVQLGVYPAVRNFSSVGCRSESVDFVVTGFFVGVLVAFLLPVYVRLALTPDALFLRYEVVCELLVVPPLLSWYLFAKLSPGFEVNVLTGNYSIIAYGMTCERDREIVGLAFLWATHVPLICVQPRSSSWCLSGFRA